MGRPAHLIVTGTYRSGTTFVERLVDNLSDGFCAPQPFPFLYLTAKRRFLTQTGREVPRYPIGTGFHDPSHRPDELATFLRSEAIDRGTIDDAFASMEGYSGAKTPELADVVSRIPEGTLGEVVRGMHGLLAQRRCPSATLLASKEVLLDEFIPTFGEAGIRVLLVVRDPRAVVASTFGPSSAAWTGQPRPLLYTIRLWRKSVAYALRFGQTVTFARLEDFAADPAGTLGTSLRALGIDTERRLHEPWLDARGEVWNPNTSFPEDAGAARARFGLSDRQLAYVEALAFPEMLTLGYAPLTDRASADDALGGLRPEDDPGRDHPAFDRDLSVDPRQLTLERERLAHLRARDDVPDESCWFVLPGVRDRLASAFSRGER